VSRPPITLTPRCARSCFQCPQCASGLATIASEASKDSKTSEERTSGAPYFLICAACKWSSKEIGWLFDKPSGLAGEEGREGR
jgi:dynactin-4